MSVVARTASNRWTPEVRRERGSPWIGVLAGGLLAPVVLTSCTWRGTLVPAAGRPGMGPIARRSCRCLDTLALEH